MKVPHLTKLLNSLVRVMGSICKEETDESEWYSSSDSITAGLSSKGSMVLVLGWSISFSSICSDSSRMTWQLGTNSGLFSVEISVLIM